MRITKRAVIILLLALALTIVMTSCKSPVRGPGKKLGYQPITMNTSDGWLITASYYPSQSQKGLILLHMLAKNRHTFDDFTPILSGSYKIIAVDLRGHGDSQGEYLDLVESDFQNMIYDVEAAAKYLQSQGVAEEDISLAGASIGANLALQYAAEHPVDKLALISPGSRLRGIDISRLSYTKSLFVQVGNYDAYASISIDELQLNWERARILRYDSAAHGTELLVYDLSAREDFLFYFS